MSKAKERISTWRPTTGVAIGLFVIAALGLAGWFLDSGLDAWTPSITIGALTVAVTITVVDHAVRREARHHVQPRVATVERTIRAPLKWLLCSIASDLVERRGHIEPFPLDALSLTGEWIDQEAETWEDDRPLPHDDGPPVMLVRALQLVRVLENIRSRDREVLDPVQVDEIDEFVRMIEQAAFLFDAVDSESPAEAHSALAILVRSIVYTTHNLVLSFNAQHPQLTELDPSVGVGAGQALRRSRPERSANADD